MSEIIPGDRVRVKGGDGTIFKVLSVWDGEAACAREREKTGVGIPLEKLEKLPPIGPMKVFM